MQLVGFLDSSESFSDSVDILDVSLELWACIAYHVGCFCQLRQAEYHHIQRALDTALVSKGVGYDPKHEQVI